VRRAFANTAPFFYDPNPSTQVSDYLFWDLTHPTTRGHQIIANEIFGEIPEPASTGLVLGGIAVFALLHRSRSPKRTPIEFCFS